MLLDMPCGHFLIAYASTGSHCSVRHNQIFMVPGPPRSGNGFQPSRSLGWNVCVRLRQSAAIFFRCWGI